jgi:hypothetical protein
MKIEIGEFKKDLSSIIKAFFYGYRKFGLVKSTHASHATHEEIQYFYDLGEMLDFWPEVEAKSDSDHQPADLVWVDDYDGYYFKPENLVLFLERETRGWEKVEYTANKFFSKNWKVTVPMGIAIIDNVPRSKLEESIKIFEESFSSNKLYKEFALVLYQEMQNGDKNKPILIKIFSRNKKGAVKKETIKAKFEFVGTYEEKDDAGFTIVSFD